MKKSIPIIEIFDDVLPNTQMLQTCVVGEPISIHEEGESSGVKKFKIDLDPRMPE